MRVLLTEGSSLTAREVITCLGPLGWRLDALDPDPLCLARLSRWVATVHRCPPASVDPVGYLNVLQRVVAEREIDVVLPTHEQAWLLAAARPLLAPELPIAVACARTARSRCSWAGPIKRTRVARWWPSSDARCYDAGATAGAPSN